MSIKVKILFLERKESCILLNVSISVQIIIYRLSQTIWSKLVACLLCAPINWTRLLSNHGIISVCLNFYSFLRPQINQLLELCEAKFFLSLTKFIEKSINIYDTKFISLDTPHNIFSLYLFGAIDINIELAKFKIVWLRITLEINFIFLGRRECYMYTMTLIKKRRIRYDPEFL